MDHAQSTPHLIHTLRALPSGAYRALGSVVVAIVGARRLATERYLSDSASIAELDQRIRSIERGERGVPNFLRNHH